MFLAALLLQASVAAPSFAPPTDTPLRIVTERSETGAGERRYRFERLVRFSRQSTGYRAEAMLLASTSAAPPALGELVERGLTALAGRKIVLHLDATGAVTAIDDMAVLWDLVCGRVAEAAASRQSLPSAEARALADRIAAPLRALPPERQRALLATLVTAAIATEPLDSPRATLPVRLSGVSPFGKPVTLEGTRRTDPIEGGLLRTTTRASATVTLTSQQGAPAATGSVELERVRTFDPRTAMIAASIDTTVNTLSATKTRLVTRLQVARATPAEWCE
jgi:hypothetical protein